MLVLVGLGNPGAQYASNRHNIGFMAVDAIADKYNFDAPRTKFNGSVQEGYIENTSGDGPRGRTKAIILKPLTYMNDSGKSVGELARFYKIAPEDIIVFHDELDLAPGKVRTKQGGGHAGHNGLRSIDAHIGNDFIRIRIGIGHPGSKAAVHNYVLGNFAKTESEWVERILSAMAGATPFLSDIDNKGLARFQSDVAHRFQPNSHQDNKNTKSGKTKPNKPANETLVKKILAEETKTSFSNPFQDALKKILGNDD